jgi:hypothetical protein
MLTHTAQPLQLRVYASLLFLRWELLKGEKIPSAIEKAANKWSETEMLQRPSDERS